MYELSDVVYLLIAFVVIHFWWKTMQARERAEAIAKKACRDENMQLLDATVSLKKIGFEKNQFGNRIFLRYFNFEFTHTGEDRRKGIIAMCASRQFYTFMDLPEKPTISIDGSDNILTRETEN